MPAPVELPAVKMAAVASQMAAAKIDDDEPAATASKLAKQDLATTTVLLNHLTARSKENQLSRRPTAELARLRKAAAPVLEQSRDKALARRSSAAAMPTARCRGSAARSAAGMLVAQPAKTERPLAGSSLSNQSGQSESAAAATAPSQTPDRTPASKWRVAATAVAATVPEKPALKYGNIGFDMAGQMHDLAELRERRNAAVTKGMILFNQSHYNTAFTMAQVN